VFHLGYSQNYDDDPMKIESFFTYDGVFSKLLSSQFKLINLLSHHRGFKNRHIVYGVLRDILCRYVMVWESPVLVEWTQSLDRDQRAVADRVHLTELFPPAERAHRQGAPQGSLLRSHSSTCELKDYGECDSLRLGRFIK